MNPIILKNKFGFATFPSVRLKGDKKTDGKPTFGNLKELLYGDYIKIYLDKKKSLIEKKVKIKGKSFTYVKVRARNQDGYLLPEEIQPDRILEVNFVDVGQGDGCHIVTPSDEHFIIDAGQSDNMYRFLRWRFNLKVAGNSPPPFTAIVSHSDVDHYKGFEKIFRPSNNKRQFQISKVYHNGIVELSGGLGSLGKLVTYKGKEFITDLCDTNNDFKKRKAKHKPGTYIKVLDYTSAPKNSLRAGKNKCIYDKSGLRIEVLGPISIPVKGKDALPVFKNNKGKTKNGHSVMLMLHMGKFRTFLGGDLNSEAEDYLLTYHTKTEIATLREELAQENLSRERAKQIIKKIDAGILKARKVFECEVAKSCHHGSSDFTTEFLRALNPIATVISSGDNEPHCHPRPDTLGSIGKYSRGERSLIFNTELSRSTMEFIDVAKIRKGIKKERAVTVYGMINLRTDGNKAIIAQKLERPAARGDWDIQKIVWNDRHSKFIYEAKERHH